MAVDDREVRQQSGLARIRSSGVRTAIVFGTVLVLCATMAAVDLLLVRLAHSERRSAARNLLRRGDDLTREGQTGRALEYYRMARNEMREDPEYRMALVSALQRVGRLDDAEDEARRVLADHPNGGPANLQVARILAAKGKTEDASWFYHRALYGTWPEGSESRRVSARLELAELLANHGATEQVVAEVLLLLNEPGSSTAIRRRSADLLMKAGAFTRAADLFREMLKQSPNDPELHAGLGRSLFSAGQFRAARTELAIAADLSPQDKDLRRNLEVSQLVIEMDPAARGIGSTERLRRSRNLLMHAVDAAQSCPADAQTDSLSEAAQLLEMKRQAPTDPDAYTRPAESIWRDLPDSCKSSPIADAQTIILGEGR